MSTNPPPHRHLNTIYEEEAIGAIFGADKLLHLAQSDPGSVLKKIPEFSFMHFACHGASINNNPNRSGLVLVKDGKSVDLTIANLEEIELKEGSVAYLSACSTAQQADSKLAGEAIHLANSFQALGFRHVIGTMWGADDTTAGEVARRFYKKLMSPTEISIGDGQLNAATALHEAVKECRLASRGQNCVLKWGPFIHVGI
ncbi:TPR domain-containing protein [Colletotrichum asianum]|uniref:TPR domain-containing protein n=1 Tax=Colletotrichum asianum TaxID=702518 RepID=A0A8H3ZPB4_9PEZI|nr:TPR domain-containing protein [Colletotrichum asianum]